MAFKLVRHLSDGELFEEMHVRPSSLRNTLLACLVLGCAWGGAQAAEPARPNIVVILFDDLGYGDLGCQGGTDIPTPRIDSLAAAGTRFTSAYSNGAVCTPTRAALIGCRYQHRFGVEGLEGKNGLNHLPLPVNTLPERLKTAGYRTCFIGKWHIGSAPKMQGFDALPNPKNLASPPEDRTLVQGALAASFIDGQRHAKQPFFLYLSFNAVHIPVHATEAYVQRFAGISDEQRRLYAAMLATADDAVGMVLDALERTGQADRTLIFCTSDNGGPTSRNGVNGSRNTPLRGSKNETFEGGIRVPLLVRWPGVAKPGTTYDQPVISFDISATALAAAGADTTATDGVDLRPFITGEKAGPPHEALYWRGRTLDDHYAVRKGDWKLVHSTYGTLADRNSTTTPKAKAGPQKLPAREMLFNLSDDPHEDRDLAAAHPEKLAELKTLFDAWSTEVDADAVALGITPPQNRE